MKLITSSKKNPEMTRQKILDYTIQLTAEKGVSGVSIQAVADMVGVSKGGVFHHFPTKQNLLEQMIVELLQRLDVFVDHVIAQDPMAHGCFTRAYIQATLPTEMNHVPFGSAISMAILTEPELNNMWMRWYQSRLRQHQQTDGDLELKILRYAADGVWLTAFADIEDANEIAAMKQQLMQRSYLESR
ncbi:TetR/AcrR family transcriptional regulator [Acinetobacter rudis]|uniref:TetR/AcrR family transcriptional regulator n=1 Tax=Acinetobacter rudis TaxID=632955 RepID=UPI00280D3FEB|nr:TetR/AcrR family transcriptional regulator [Acinetobacter rudis]MDQ8954116.1 TetR/AcrR family transcriptional regulator [Acinetobacter rudis]